ncbi:M16 family metallopeptidase [Tsuneonella mangrovi]|uniref:M16 family metallopeptidase n=1 Tax=Tsuneonella mangrovi TaxID=1982042 RepID=UPI000BA2539B|nr:M16 family metallopeptidase [Tsuneonella mangrovi]
MRFVAVAVAALALAITPSLQAETPPTLATLPDNGPAENHQWTYRQSDIPVDPAWTFGTLPNGMRYALRHNQTPAGTALVRLRIGSGSLEETPDERGLAHFLEHMAFNGSTHVPEGEMVKLLERKGLAFGADTNASTGFEATTYKLDLPNVAPDMIDTALMLMRETASNLTLAQDAIDRERGVILSEKRDRTNYSLRDVEDQWAFLTPDARYTRRLPIGTTETIDAANSQRLRAFYSRNYVPSNAVLIVVGDIDVAKVEAKIRAEFASWTAAPPPPPPVTGPIDPARKGLTDVFLDPALSEKVTATRMEAWHDRPDSVAERRQNLLRQIGYAIVNRRLSQLARSDDPPFRSAGFGTGDIFESGRMTNLVINTVDGGWQKGLEAAARVYRQAMSYGFSDAEVAEQVARQRAAQVNAAGSADTRSNAALVSAADSLIEDGLVPSTPQSSLERFNAFAPQITPAAVLAALKADAAPLDDPMIRFEGRVAPNGGAGALRATWTAAMAAPLAPPVTKALKDFGYSDFGTPGKVVSDVTTPKLGIREIRFANGVRLDLKRTTLAKDRISFHLAIAGGDLLNTKQDPLATAMVSSLPMGGLGKHSQDEIESILAGRTVRFSIGNRGDAFVMSGGTIPKDLPRQLDLLAAAITDPGYRIEGQVRFHRSIDDYFKRKDATPGSALGTSIGGILSGGDPRFTLQPQSAYEALTFAKLKDAISGNLQHGAIELALVGDFDPDRAIALVAKTLGALPSRAADFDDAPALRHRPFTDQRTRHVIYHTGEADQALIAMVWPTVDDRNAAEDARLEMLERVVQIELQEELRERLGKTYSPGASSDPSDLWIDYGTFSIYASVDVKDVAVSEAAIRAVIERLAREPVSADTLDRARQPLLESYANALKSNGGWMRLVARAQTRPDRIARFAEMPGLIGQVTASDVEAAAARFLRPDQAVEILALPKPGDTEPPANN